MSLQLQAKLKTASAEYQRLQADLSNVVEARQRLDAQLSENDLVKKVATLCGRSGRNYNRVPGVCSACSRQHNLQANRSGARQTGSGRGKEQR